MWWVGGSSGWLATAEENGENVCYPNRKWLDKRDELPALLACGEDCLKNQLSTTVRE